MQAIYVSDSFVVVQLQPEVAVPPSDAATDTAANMPADAAPGAMTAHPVLTRRGFEIVDRRSNREVYLDGAWAEAFARQIQAWQQESPSQDEVEATLDGYAALAQTPVALH